MKANKVTMAAVVLIGLTGWAEDGRMTPSDLDHARLYLQQTRDEIVGATKGLTPEQWNFKPAPDRWSIAQIVEHIALAQDLILGPIHEQLAKAPAGGERNNKAVDEAIVSLLPDRTAKFQAPDVLLPTGRWTPAVAMDRLLKNYTQLRTLLETTPDLRDHAIDAPPLKAVSKGAYDSMDGYQWILAAAGHTERHTKQILEVRADPNFPMK